jgi:hypothetical protein
MLAGRGQERHKLVGRWAQVADAAVGGQRADVEEYAGRTLKMHVLIIERQSGLGRLGRAVSRIILLSRGWFRKSN